MIDLPQIKPELLSTSSNKIAFTPSTLKVSQIFESSHNEDDLVHSDDGEEPASTA